MKKRNRTEVMKKEQETRKSYTEKAASAPVFPYVPAEERITEQELALYLKYMEDFTAEQEMARKKHRTMMLGEYRVISSSRMTGLCDKASAKLLLMEIFGSEENEDIVETAGDYIGMMRKIAGEMKALEDMKAGIFERIEKDFVFSVYYACVLGYIAYLDMEREGKKGEEMFLMDPKKLLASESAKYSENSFCFDCSVCDLKYSP